MPLESWKLLGLGEGRDQNGYLLWQRVKGKYSVELSKVSLASSGLPGGGFGFSASGLPTGKLCPPSFLRSRRHCSSLLAFVLLKLSVVR